MFQMTAATANFIDTKHLIYKAKQKWNKSAAFGKIAAKRLEIKSVSGRDSFVIDVVVVALRKESEVLQFVFLAFRVSLIVAKNLLFVLEN
jgi:hypothetical protein